MRGAMLRAGLAGALAAMVVIAGAPVAGPARAESPAAGLGAMAEGKLVGWDTYRRLDLLPYLAASAETHQFSSFDRAGGNEHDGFDGRYSCLRRVAAGCVIAEATGAGEISSIWFTRYEDIGALGRLTVVLDGRTVLDANLAAVVDGDLGAPFAYPLVANPDQSSGGAYLKVPMPYRTSMRVTLEHPGYYHVSYRRFAGPGGVPTFDPTDPAQDVLATLRAAGTADPKPPASGKRTVSRRVDLVPGAASPPTRIDGSGVITELRLRLPQVAGHDPASDEILARTRLRIDFDGRTTVDAPVGEFFGSGLGEYRVRSLLFAMDPGETGAYQAWWPMPYARTASVTLVNDSSRQLTGGTLTVTHAPDPQWTAALAAGGDAGYFTALSRQGATEPFADWVFAEQGGRGKFVGVSHTMTGTDPSGWGRTYLEGDERVYVDGSRTPQLYGTGTEDFYEGGWYFDRGPFSAPLNGHSAHESRAGGCQYECDAAYRIMLADAVSYRSRLRFGIEHGGNNAAPADYGSTAFLYAQPGRSARPTDLLDLGEPASRDAHGYTEHGAASQTTLTSVFEGANDHASVTDQVRTTGSAVSFRLAVDPSNQGVTLRRVADQQAGYQAARVLVDGVVVGTWSQPLGNPHQRWREDTFPLPAQLTAGKSTVDIRLEPAAGAPDWTAASYAAVSAGPPVPARTAGGTDFDGDGLDDAVAFTQDGAGEVFVATSTGAAFGPRQRWHDSFAPAGEHPVTGDVDGDGRDDIVSFTRGDPWATVDVALSTGTSFGPRTRWHDHFSPAGETPAVGDVNGDGRDDLITFTHGDPWAVVYVALSTGSSFGPTQQWHVHFAPAGETPAVADVDGDGREDIVTFTHGDPWAVVYVALSTGSSFGPTQQWHHHLAAAGETPRVGDLNGDGLADILTFTQGGTADVYAAMSTGVSFGPAEVWHGQFAPAGEYPRVGHFDRDGLADAATFTRTTAADAYVATSDGWRFGGSRTWRDGFGFPGETIR